MVLALATFPFPFEPRLSGYGAEAAEAISHPRHHHVMKHCKGSAFLRGSVKSDPLDAWGEQSELEIEGGRLINPPPTRSVSTETKVEM